MPKVSRIRSKGTSATSVARTPLLTPKEAIIAKKNNDKSNQDDNDGAKALSRGQRKRQAKRDQYLKREKMILSTLKLQQVEEQKNRLDGLDAIKQALAQTIKENQEKKEAEHESQEGDGLLKTNKSKKTVAQKEISHLNLVLQHPSFKCNPFATMQQHLRNTLAQQAKDQEVEAKKQRNEEEKKDKEKKEAKKERIRNAKYEKGRKQRGRKK